MRRFILDTGIAGLYFDRTRGVFERAAAEVASGNRVGIAAPVLGELALRAEGSPKREQNLLRLRQALDVWVTDTSMTTTAALTTGFDLLLEELSLDRHPA